MLIVRRIGIDAAGYYRHDRSGRWWGAGCEALGLDGEVSPVALRRVLAARDPGAGMPLHATRVDRRAGWDLVFAAPKSISVLAATAPAVGAAHAAAVDDALEWVEQHACWARRPSGTVAADGLVAARFGHRTSSAGDPHLHDHVLVANLAGAAGSWSAIDQGGLWLQRKALAAAYHLGLRHHLLARGLSFEWSLDAIGAADVVGVPRRVLEATSTRRRQVLAQREVEGRREGRAHDRVATRGTGDGVPHPPEWDPADLLADAARRADARRTRRAEAGSNAPGRAELVRSVLEHLAAERSRYGPTEVMEALARSHPDGTAARDAHRWALALCDASHRCPDGRFTSPMAARADRHLADTMAGGAGRGLGRVPAGVVDAAVAARPELGPRSIRSLRRLLLGGDAVAVIGGAPVGAASRSTEEAWVGQAALLEAAVEAWTGAGHRVALDATSEPARRRFEVLTGVDPARTNQAATVLLVDRADRRPTAQLQGLLDRSRAEGAMVVLVEGGTLPARRRALSEGLEAGAGSLGRLTRLAPEEVQGRTGAIWERAMDAWSADPQRHLLVGLGPAEAAELNRRARLLLGADRPAATLAGRSYSVGDAVRSLGSRSGRPAGQVGVVASIGRDGRSLMVGWSDGATEPLIAHRARALGHGWATTPAMARRTDDPLVVVGGRADLGRLARRVVAEVGIADGRDLARTRQEVTPPGLGR